MTVIVAKAEDPKVDSGARGLRAFLSSPGWRRSTLASAALTFCLFYAVLNGPYRFAFSQSESLSHSVFWLSPSDTQLVKGDYVALRTPPNPFLDQNVVKRVVGVAGDAVVLADRMVIVEGVPIGEAKTASRAGEPLDIIAPVIIPEGYVFLAGDHKDSFDSRYMAFGLIPVAGIETRAKVLF